MTHATFAAVPHAVVQFTDERFQRRRADTLFADPCSFAELPQRTLASAFLLALLQGARLRSSSQLHLALPR